MWKDAKQATKDQKLPGESLCPGPTQSSFLCHHHLLTMGVCYNVDHNNMKGCGLRSTVIWNNMVNSKLSSAHFSCTEGCLPFLGPQSPHFSQGKGLCCSQPGGTDQWPVDDKVWLRAMHLGDAVSRQTHTHIHTVCVYNARSQEECSLAKAASAHSLSPLSFSRWWSWLIPCMEKADVSGS